MRQVIIRDPDAIPPKPAELVYDPTGLPLCTDRLAHLVASVRAVRALQTLYRRTIDSVTRRAMEQLEEQLDAEVGQIAADLAAAKALVSSPTEAERGAA